MRDLKEYASALRSHASACKSAQQASVTPRPEDADVYVPWRMPYPEAITVATALASDLLHLDLHEQARILQSLERTAEAFENGARVVTGTPTADLFEKDCSDTRALIVKLRAAWAKFPV